MKALSYAEVGGQSAGIKQLLNLLNFVVYKLFYKPSGTRIPQFTKAVAEVFRLSSKCEILLSDYQILKAFLSGLKRDS